MIETTTLQTTLSRGNLAFTVGEPQRESVTIRAATSVDAERLHHEPAPFVRMGFFDCAASLDSRKSGQRLCHVRSIPTL